MDAEGPRALDGLAASAETVLQTNQERTVYHALSTWHSRLGQMYLGALWVLVQTNNPDRFALASNGLREVMEKIPRYVDVETKPFNESETQELRQLEEMWVSTIQRSSCRNDETWSGPIDPPLAHLLERLETFFKWRAKHRPSMRDATMDAFGLLDPSIESLPEPLRRFIYKDWDDLQKYFNSVCHHNREPDEQEFRERRDELEKFLLERLLPPRTFADFDDIDAIITEGERNA